MRSRLRPTRAHTTSCPYSTHYRQHEVRYESAPKRALASVTHGLLAGRHRSNKLCAADDTFRINAPRIVGCNEYIMLPEIRLFCTQATQNFRGRRALLQALAGPMPHCKKRNENELRAYGLRKQGYRGRLQYRDVPTICRQAYKSR